MCYFPAQFWYFNIEVYRVCLSMGAIRKTAGFFWHFHFEFISQLCRFLQCINLVHKKRTLTEFKCSAKGPFYKHPYVRTNIWIALDFHGAYDIASASASESIYTCEGCLCFYISREVCFSWQHGPQCRVSEGSVVMTYLMHRLGAEG